MGFKWKKKEEWVEVLIPADTEPAIPGMPERPVMELRDVPEFKDITIYGTSEFDAENPETFTPGYGRIVWNAETCTGSCPVCETGHLSADYDDDI